MANVYADLIKKGLKTLDEVPANLRDSVAELLNLSEVKKPNVLETEKSGPITNERKFDGI